jgi:hypothetical protein
MEYDGREETLFLKMFLLGVWTPYTVAIRTGPGVHRARERCLFLSRENLAARQKTTLSWTGKRPLARSREANDVITVKLRRVLIVNTTRTNVLKKFLKKLDYC